MIRGLPGEIFLADNEMNKKIVIGAGGTGGHLFPALALAQALRSRAVDSDLLFVGGGLEVNRYFDQQAFPFQQVACGSFVSRKPLDLLRNGYSLALGIAQSISLFRRFRPDIVVGFGSFYGFPPLAAARALGIPIVLYESNATPGRVVRLMAPSAVVTGVHFDATASRLKGKAVTVGMPLRESVEGDRVVPAIARQCYGLAPTKTTLLIFGGSQGAQALNEGIVHALPFVCQGVRVPLQVIHFTGREESVIPVRQAYASHGISCHVAAFETRMGLAWSAADLVLCRSGAGTVAEVRSFAVPAVMIPYPYATDAHQDYNADVIVTLGGGQKVLQNNLTPSLLASVLISFINNDHGMRSAMHQALLKSKQELSKVTLTDLVWQTLNHS